MWICAENDEPPYPTTTNPSGSFAIAGTSNRESCSGLVLHADNNDNDRTSSLPRNLLHLIRSLEKKRKKDEILTEEEEEEEDEDRIEQTVDLLNHLIAMYSRRGLLQGCVTKAERIPQDNRWT
jgi:hypothetical protein